ncbi:MAG: DUF3365 domain-containing protein [Candidatus Latescibacteria bacterium]|nr:DUF3365 domain-containing protein [Candidatus Latescibacterota bacterium]
MKGKDPSTSRAGFSIGVYLNLSLGAVFLVIAVATVFLVNYFMRERALEEAAIEAEMLLDHNLAIHTYFNGTLKPALFAQIPEARSADHFDPVWMSSTYAVRHIDQLFESLAQKGYYYKECAINARSPENEANEYERAFLEELKTNPQLEKRAEVRSVQGQPYLVYLRRGETMEAGCLRCHSSAEVAPRRMVERYGAERSFNRHPGDLADVISIRIPLQAAYAHIARTTWQLSGAFLVLLASLFTAQLGLVRWLVLAPLDRIREKALLISAAEEHLGGEIPIPRGKELAEMTAAFNALNVSLRQHRDQLEMRVQERTRELAQLNEQLQQSEEKFRTFMETASDLMFIHDREGNFVYVNDTMARTLGYSKEEMIGMPHRLVLTEEELDQGFAKRTEEFLATGRLSIEDNWVTKDGRKIACAVNAVAVFDDHKQFVGARGIVRDITARKVMEAELEQQKLRTLQADRLQSLGEMATGIAHELNQPLASIRLFAEGLLLNLEMKRPPSQEKLQTTLDEINAQVERMDEIINHMRAFSRESSSEKQVQFQPAEVIRGTMKLVGAQLRVHGIQVEVSCSEELPLCVGRPYQLEQVLLNLINNARDALESRQAHRDQVEPEWWPWLGLQGRVESEGRWVRLSVSDNGGGMPEEVLPRIFEPFFTTKEVGKGTGLGLAIVRGIIEQHQGRLEVDNRLGEGVTFSIVLPASPVAGPGPAA